MRERVEQLLESVRSRLRMDGCDVVLLDVSEDGVVRLQFKGGACCPMSRIALVSGIEGMLREALPEIRAVVAV